MPSKYKSISGEKEFKEKTIDKIDDKYKILEEKNKTTEEKLDKIKEENAKLKFKVLIYETNELKEEIYNEIETISDIENSSSLEKLTHILKELKKIKTQF